MKTELKQIKNYLLLIDSKSEIKEGDIIYSVLYGIGKIIEDYGGESTKRYRPLIAKFQNSNVQQEYGRDGVWQLGVDGATVAKNNCKKVIAYYPLEEAKELNLPLLPSFEEEIDTYELLKKIDGTCEKGEYEHWLFNEGYKSAQFKGTFTQEDMKKAIEMAREIKDKEDIFDMDSIIGLTEVCTHDWEERYSEEEIIQSLSIQQLPKDFIPIMKCGRCFKPDDSEEECWSAKECSRHNGDYKDLLKTIINSEGKEELVGKYTF